MNKLLYSIVVPVYKSTESLKELSYRVKAVFDEIEGADYELIFINDSPFLKDTVRCLQELSENNKNIVVIELMKNFGQQAATLCGIEHARGDYIITMDDDLQHAPEDIIHLIEKREHDVVIARFKAKKHSFFKRITSEIKSYFDYIILGKPKHIKLTSFRLIKADIAKLMFKRKTPYPFIPALLFSITDDIENVELKHYSRQDGESNYTFVKMLQVFSNLIINNSSFLLRIIGYIGISIALLSGVSTVFIGANKLIYGVAVAGWTSIMLLILFFGGMIMFTLGIIGEYLLRIIATTEERPVCYVRKISSSRES
jgi:dolichol-phosphate mannosyltransferase/undecaprenyl-phosphate 4-deoxy-4-formamido-L-arabinose transferase